MEVIKIHIKRALLGSYVFIGRNMEVEELYYLSVQVPYENIPDWCLKYQAIFLTVLKAG